MPNIVCIVGPTASGKTALSVRLAKELGGEVISFDSMQVYKRMDIGTAKPTEEEMCGVPHHMLSVAEPGDAFSVGKYVQMADAVLQDVLARGKTAVLVGGTGLYIDALIAGREFADEPSSALREKLERRADTEGLEVLLKELAVYDPETAARLHLKDRKRILRAMEVYETTGKPISLHNAETRALPPKYHAAWLGLWYSDRSVLYGRIDRRVDLMLQAGLLDEVRALTEEDLPEACTAMAAIGYKEFVAALKGQCSVEEAAEAVKQGSRRYAKRQMTWFGRNKSIFWIDRCKEITDEDVFLAARQYLTDFDKT